MRAVSLGHQFWFDNVVSRGFGASAGIRRGSGSCFEAFTLAGSRGLVNNRIDGGIVLQRQRRFVRNAFAEPSDPWLGFSGERIQA